MFGEDGALGGFRFFQFAETPLDFACQLRIESGKKLGLEFPASFKNRHQFRVHAEFIRFLLGAFGGGNGMLGRAFVGFVEHILPYRACVSSLPEVTIVITKSSIESPPPSGRRWVPAALMRGQRLAQAINDALGVVAVALQRSLYAFGAEHVPSGARASEMPSV